MVVVAAMGGGGASAATIITAAIVMAIVVAAGGVATAATAAAVMVAMAAATSIVRRGGIFVRRGRGSMVSVVIAIVVASATAVAAGMMVVVLFLALGFHNLIVHRNNVLVSNIVSWPVLECKQPQVSLQVGIAASVVGDISVNMLSNAIQAILDNSSLFVAFCFSRVVTQSVQEVFDGSHGRVGSVFIVAFVRSFRDLVLLFSPFGRGTRRCVIRAIRSLSAAAF